MSAACDPASDDWAENFVFTKDDGYLSVEWFPVVDGYSDDGQHVAFVDAGDTVPDLLQKLREFTPAIGSVEVEDDDENESEDEDDG